MPPKPQSPKGNPQKKTSPNPSNQTNKKASPSSPASPASPVSPVLASATKPSKTAVAATEVAKVEKKTAVAPASSALKTQLEEMFSKSRESITLIKQPLRCLRLFLEITVIEGFALGLRILKHPLMLFGGIPFIIVSLIISAYVIPSEQQTLFRTLDLNNDGSVSAQEISTSTGVTVGSVLEAMGGLSDFTYDGFAAWHTASTAASSNQTLVSNFISYLPHNYWREGEYIIADVLWWFILGVLSSVGLGTGMHSGLLFLFPMIFLACRAADACGNSNFWTYPSNIFYGPRERVFTCVQPTLSGIEPVSLLVRFLKVAPWCMIWGAGTALGEVPPYLLAYAAAKEGRKTDEIEEGLNGSSWNILNRMMQWMLEKIKRHGFWAILLLAAWPNAAFDLCGMACGQFLMPFWTFFGATLIGKALIKINMQTLFFVLLFSGDTIESFLKGVAVRINAILPPSIPIASGIDKAVEMLANTRTRFSDRASGRAVEGEGEDDSKGPNYFQIAMQWVVVLAVGWFAKSIIDTFAQKRQQAKDEAAIEALLSKSKSEGASKNTDSIVKQASEDLSKKALQGQIASVLIGAVAIAYFANRYYL